MRRFWARSRPFRRKVGKWVVWILMLYTVFRTGSELGKAKERQNFPSASPALQALATHDSVSSFASAFVNEFLAYSPSEDAGQRANRLAPFLGAGVDPTGGLVLDSIQGIQRVVAVWPARTEDAGPQKYRITVLARVQVQATTSVAKPVAAPGGLLYPTPTQSPPNPQGDAQLRFVSLSVPVAATTSGLVIFDVPTFTPWQGSPGHPDSTYEGTQLQDTDQSISGVVQGFLRAWMSGSDSELKVFTQTSLPSFRGEVRFRALNGVKLLQQPSGVVVALADTEVQDPVSSAIFRQRYTLGLQQISGHWQVTTTTPILEPGKVK